MNPRRIICYRHDSCGASHSTIGQYLRPCLVATPAELGKQPIGRQPARNRRITDHRAEATRVIHRNSAGSGSHPQQAHLPVDDSAERALRLRVV
jgi:hypothetical protein